MQVQPKWDMHLQGRTHEEVNVHRDCTVVSCEACVDRVLKTHGWDAPISESTEPTAPLPVDCINRIHKDIGQPENSKEHCDLVDKHGFKYRQLLGELSCACVTCRPDIGCAVITLSKFSTCPADMHFTVLKKVAKYLRATKSWGIVYQRSSVDPSLPPRPDERIDVDPTLPPFPTTGKEARLIAFFDAAHGNDLRNRRSTTV